MTPIANERRCASCKTPLGRKRRIYCSHECRWRKEGVPQKICPTCKDLFKGDRLAQVYCSKKCGDTRRQTKPIPSDGYWLIPLSRGLFAKIDESDLSLISEGSAWTATNHRKTRYAKSGDEYLHRLIMNPEPGMYVDHINGDGLDNRRANLRTCTHRQNLANQYAPRGSSKFKGVFWSKDRGRWTAQARNKAGVTRHLGVFSSEEDAARAYDAAARKAHGEFARLNFPEEAVQ